MRLNIKQVEAFSRVFITGSVTAAAQHLHVSQPAVSRLVADIELAVGLTCCSSAGTAGSSRRLKRVHAVRRDRERLLVGLEKIASRAEEIRSFRSGSIRIAAMPALSFSILPAVIQEFTTKYPGIHISLNISSSESVFDWLGSHQMDLGIAALPAQTKR